MLLRTNPPLARILSRVLTRDGAFPPLLVTGRPGTGRATHIRALVRAMACEGAYQPFDGPAGWYDTECGCEGCERFRLGGLADYHELARAARIEPVRAVQGFVGHPPLWLARRVLVLRDIDALGAAALDTLLRLTEEPGETLVLATAHRADLLPATVRSRFWAVPHPDLTAEQINEIVEVTPELHGLQPWLGRHRFGSLGEARLYARHDLGELVDSCQRLPGLDARIRRFVAVLREHPDLADTVALTLSVLAASLERRSSDPENLAARRLRATYPAVLRGFDRSLGAWLHRPDRDARIDLARQLTALFTAVILLRHSLGI